MISLFEFDDAFLAHEMVPLDVDDLKYGHDHGWVSAATVIRCATRAVVTGDPDPVLLEVACLSPDQENELRDVLARLDLPGRVVDPRESQRKWLYLVLAFVYANRSQFADPLGIVEEIYAEFDYPVSIVRLVRYMPAQRGDVASPAGLLDRWRTFLDQEGADLRR